MIKESLSLPLSRADFTPSWHVPERDENQGNGIHCDPDTASGTEQFIIATTLNSAGKRHIIGYQWETPFCIGSNLNLCLDFWILLSIQKKNKIPSIKFTTQTGDPPRAYPASHTEVAGIVSSPMATLNWISECRWVSGLQLYRPRLECQNYKGKPSRSYPAFHSHANCALQLFRLSCIWKSVG